MTGLGGGFTFFSSILDTAGRFLAKFVIDYPGSDNDIAGAKVSVYSAANSDEHNGPRIVIFAHSCIGRHGRALPWAECLDRSHFDCRAAQADFSLVEPESADRRRMKLQCEDQGVSLLR